MKSKNICPYCKQLYSNTHNCKYVKRLKHLTNPMGQMAFELWKRFHTYNKLKFCNGDIKEQFIKVSLYDTFIKLVQFIHESNISKPYSYMNFLLKNEIPLIKWCKYYTYNKWVYENLMYEEPYVALERSLMTIISTAQELKISPNQFFNIINESRLHDLILSGKISPYIIFANSNIKTVAMTKLKTLEKDKLELFMNEYYWQYKLEHNTEPKCKEILEIINTEF